ALDVVKTRLAQDAQRENRGAKGDITGTSQVLWSRRRGTPYVPSPLLYGDTIYNLQHYQGAFGGRPVAFGGHLLDQVRTTHRLAGLAQHPRGGIERAGLRRRSLRRFGGRRR